MTPKQHARDLARKWEHGDDAHRQWLRDMIVPDLVAALDAVRREAIEACVSACEKAAMVDPFHPNRDHALWKHACEDCEERIRDMLSAPPDVAVPDPPTEADEMLEMRLSTLAFRMQCRVDACVERNGTVDAAVTSSGVGISYLLARELATTLRAAAERFERGAPDPTRALARLFAAWWKNEQAAFKVFQTANLRCEDFLYAKLIEPDGMVRARLTDLGEAALCLAEDGR